MEQEESVTNIIDLLAPHLSVGNNGNSGSLAVMMCGISGLLSYTLPAYIEEILTQKGAGKSTLSYALVDAFPSFTRLSIDGIVADRHGIYNVDYQASEYTKLLEEARQIFLKEAHDLLEKKNNLVLDTSLYAKKHRDEYKAMIERAGGRWVLVYLKAERDVLRKRICDRRGKGVNADSAREINPALFEHFLQ